MKRYLLFMQPVRHLTCTIKHHTRGILAPTILFLHFAYLETHINDAGWRFGDLVVPLAGWRIHFVYFPVTLIIVESFPPISAWCYGFSLLPGGSPAISPVRTRIMISLPAFYHAPSLESSDISTDRFPLLVLLHSPKLPGETLISVQADHEARIYVKRVELAPAPLPQPHDTPTPSSRSF